MIQRRFRSSLKHYFSSIDWKLLVFLILFLNVKLILKIAAIAFVFAFSRDFKLGLSRKKQRLPFFYLCAIGIALFDWILYKGFPSLNYSFAIFTGIIFWLVCILAVHHVKLSVENYDAKIIYNTLIVFFIINSFVSFAELLKIIIETGTINPYRYQGEFQKYFISTGDYIKGISFDTCTTNAILNSFGIVFFLSKKNIQMVLLCMIVLLLTASNLVNLILLLTFLFLFIFQSDRDQKSVLVVCCCLLIVFFVKISPQNNSYATVGAQKLGLIHKDQNSPPSKELPVQYQPDNILSEEERKEKIAHLYIDSILNLRSQLQKKSIASNGFLFAMNIQPKPEIPRANIHTAPYQHRNDTNEKRQRLLKFLANNKVSFPSSFQYSKAGKLVSFQQTFRFLYQHPIKLLFGDGIGNFSSKLAFRTTDLKIAGGYPSRLSYINNDFLNNHLALYLFYFSADKEKHSAINSPNSVYNQLAGEYGLLGILSFFLFYVGYFLKDYKNLSYGVPLMILLLGFFFMDYWFEQLSIVTVFELMLFLNQKEPKEHV